MKKSEVKNLIRQIVKEQRGMAPGPVGQTMGTGGTRPPMSTAPVGGQTAGGSSGGNSNMTSQLQALLAQGQAAANKVTDSESKSILTGWLQELIRLIRSSGTIQT